MAFSGFRMFRNGYTNFSGVVRNIHPSPKLRADSTMKTSEIERRFMTVVKFTLVFLPGVYVGAFLQSKGAFSKKIANEVAQNVHQESDSLGSFVKDKIEDISAKIDDKKDKKK